jgi:hypothetical protein
MYEYILQYLELKDKCNYYIFLKHYKLMHRDHPYILWHDDTIEFCLKNDKYIYILFDGINTFTNIFHGSSLKFSFCHSCNKKKHFGFEYEVHEKTNIVFKLAYKYERFDFIDKLIQFALNKHIFEHERLMYYQKVIFQMYLLIEMNAKMYKILDIIYNPIFINVEDKIYNASFKCCEINPSNNILELRKFWINILLRIAAENYVEGIHILFDDKYKWIITKNGNVLCERNLINIMYYNINDTTIPIMENLKKINRKIGARGIKIRAKKIGRNDIAIKL